MGFSLEHPVFYVQLFAQVSFFRDVPVFIHDENIWFNLPQFSLKVEHPGPARDERLLHAGDRLYHEEAFLLVIDRRSSLEIRDGLVRSQRDVEIPV